jgi:hypothetical protein
MEKAAALKILQQLADGIDPHTGQSFGADSPYQHPDTVRALFLALRELDDADGAVHMAPVQLPAKSRAAANPNAPSNSGKPWSDDEDHALAAGFDAGKKILELATAHGRSRFAIEARLAKLGKIEPPANLRGNGARPHTAASQIAAYAVQH